MKNKLNLILIVFITLFFYFITFMVASGRLSLNVMLLYVTLSIATFFLYMKDKSAAKSHDWRIKERTLFLFGLLGGWLGALFAQRVFHHKTQKTQFQLIYWLTVVINCGGTSCPNLYLGSVIQFQSRFCPRKPYHRDMAIF